MKAASFWQSVRPWLKRGLIAVAALFLLIGLSVAGLLGTGAGRSFSADLINRLASSEDQRIEITGLDPTLYRATVLPNIATVIVVGPEPMLPERDQLRVVVDLAGLAAGNHQISPQGLLIDQELTEDMTISVRPEQLDVTIEALSPTATPEPTPTPDPSTGPPPTPPTPSG